MREASFGFLRILETMKSQLSNAGDGCYVNPKEVRGACKETGHSWILRMDLLDRVDQMVLSDDILVLTAGSCTKVATLQVVTHWEVLAHPISSPVLRMSL